MKLRFTLQARQDLDNIAEYIATDAPEAALRVRAAILASLQVLVLFPRIGRRQRTEGVRKLVTQRYRYIVYYTIDDTLGEIAVLTIQHPSRERGHVDR